MRLEELSTRIYACLSSSTACGLCRTQCPSLECWGVESRTPRGRMALCAHLLRGNLKPSPALSERMFSCTLCGNCDSVCPVGAEPSRVIEAARERLRKEGFLPQKYRERGSHVAREHNPYLEPHRDRLSWLPAGLNLPERAPVVYFVGCTSSYREKGLARKTVELLRRMGVDFTLCEDEWCCGSFLLRTGQDEVDGTRVEEMASHNLEEVRKRGAKTVVVSCPGCYRAWRRDYPELGVEPDFEVLHLTQFLEREGVKGRERGRVRVTYHDPCHLGRHMGVYEEPRRILSALPGVELVEMPRNRENSWCCGSGGGFRAGYPEASRLVARRRLEEARGTGAELLVTSCPFCLRQLKETAEALGFDLRVMDLAEFLVERCG